MEREPTKKDSVFESVMVGNAESVFCEDDDPFREVLSDQICRSKTSNNNAMSFHQRFCHLIFCF